VRVILCLLLTLSFTFSVEKLFYVMGTYAYVELPSDEEAYKAYRIMRSVEEKISDYMEDSEVSLINRNSGKRAVKVSEETMRVLRLALIASEKTYGYFDITIGAVTVNHRRHGRLTPEEAERLVNFRDVFLGENRVLLRKKGMAIDLGGIGKGYALDVVRERIGSPWGFVSIAGDMKVWGTEKVIAVKDPLSGGSLLQGINAGEMCISTSGNYLRKHIEQHDEELLQVTVVYHTCALADAYATALFSMPRDLRRRFMLENPDVGVLELYGDGSLYMNPAFRKSFKLITFRGEVGTE